MNVSFKRTTERSYAVIVEFSGKAPQMMNPAPGFDDFIPHDLVHYLVEAELELSGGVFGRAASGGGTFIPAAEDERSPRERARQRRRQSRRELTLSTADAARDLVTSERLAGICDLVWRRRQGQRPNPALWKPTEALSAKDAERVDRVVARLNEVAPVWSRLPVGGVLSFTWPNTSPTRARTA